MNVIKTLSLFAFISIISLCAGCQQDKADIRVGDNATLSEIKTSEPAPADTPPTTTVVTGEPVIGSPARPQEASEDAGRTAEDKTGGIAVKTEY